MSLPALKSANISLDLYMAVPLFHSVKRNVQVLQREDLIPQLVSNLVQSWTEEKRIFGEQVESCAFSEN